MLEKDKYKLFLLVVKVIPMLMAFIFFINTILSYFGIDIKVFNYITCIGILPLIPLKKIILFLLIIVLMVKF